jgi:penicillin amidase
MRAGAPPWGDRETPGSNSFAVAGVRADGGGALVANDMHLHLGVPNIWYRMSLRWPGHSETGVTLPGSPTLVAGSTGRIAWGFTNSNAGTGDLLVVDPSISPALYHGPKAKGLLPYEKRTEAVAVRGSKPVSMDFDWTVWGPVVGEAGEGRQLVYHWTEDDPAATNLDIMDLEDAASAREAVAIAHHMGLPAQNFVVADSIGQIAWTVAGFLPKRVGYDGRLPVSWSFGDRRWEGYLASGEVPSVVSPAEGILWTANNRTVGGKALEAVGDSGYDMAARARQIQDDLGALLGGSRPVQPADLLSVQLDDRAVLLEKWHALLIDTLRGEVVSGKPARAALLGASQKWEGRADAGSVSYGVVRAFRLAVVRRILDPIFAPCLERDPGFTWTRFNYEQAIETILRTRPVRLLDPSFATWDDLLVAAADDVARSYREAGNNLGTATWGTLNAARIEHPFARFLPRWAATWLAMPVDPLPGDSNMPRIQHPNFGASERFVVSPGHEDAGLFNMPGGQCSNPLSPYFRAGHEAWVRGDPTPFLPGRAEHTLELAP